MLSPRSHSLEESAPEGILDMFGKDTQGSTLLSSHPDHDQALRNLMDSSSYANTEEESQDLRRILPAQTQVKESELLSFSQRRQGVFQFLNEERTPFVRTPAVQQELCISEADMIADRQALESVRAGYLHETFDLEPQDIPLPKSESREKTRVMRQSLPTSKLQPNGMSLAKSIQLGQARKGYTMYDMKDVADVDRKSMQSAAMSFLRTLRERKEGKSMSTNELHADSTECNKHTFRVNASNLPPVPEANFGRENLTSSGKSDQQPLSTCVSAGLMQRKPPEKHAPSKRRLDCDAAKLSFTTDDLNDG